MSKQLPFALLLSFCAGPATAQTLTDANSIPAVGYSETRVYYNASNTPAWALSGTGNTWDATAVETFGLSATVAYRAPGDSPFASSYPTTTLCAERFQNGNTEWRHYLVDAAHAEMIGISAENFSGGRTYCTYPFSIGSTFTDDWFLNGNTYSDTYTYVASGSIVAPWGTIPDVVMFETAGGFSYYLYLANNLLDPIGDYTPGFGISLWKVETATSIADAGTLHMGLWPNPATDAVTLSLPQGTGFSYSLVGANGQVVHSGNSTGERTVIHLRDRAAGVYTVLAVDARGSRAVGRLVVD